MLYSVEKFLVWPTGFFSIIFLLFQKWQQLESRLCCFGVPEIVHSLALHEKKKYKTNSGKHPRPCPQPSPCPHPPVPPRCPACRETRRPEQSSAARPGAWPARSRLGSFPVINQTQFLSYYFFLYKCASILHGKGHEFLFFLKVP